MKPATCQVAETIDVERAKAVLHADLAAFAAL